MHRFSSLCPVDALERTGSLVRLNQQGNCYEGVAPDRAVGSFFRTVPRDVGFRQGSRSPALRANPPTPGFAAMAKSACYR
jgi:hypothetical protein